MQIFLKMPILDISRYLFIRFLNRWDGLIKVVRYNYILILNTYFCKYNFPIMPHVLTIWYPSNINDTVTDNPQNWLLNSNCCTYINLLRKQAFELVKTVHLQVSLHQPYYEKKSSLLHAIILIFQNHFFNWIVIISSWSSLKQSWRLYLYKFYNKGVQKDIFLIIKALFYCSRQYLCH